MPAEVQKYSIQDPPAESISAVIPVHLLQPADSPRIAGEDAEHVRALAETESELPPILVHRGTMRVIDGMHRLRAAALNGCSEIAVRFYDGTEEEAFVAAVKANVTHGLPLARADREAAAARIIKSYPQWSDRAIAGAAGLSPQTVAKIRGRVLAQAAPVHKRLGRDGRSRPLSSAAGRRSASRLIAERPGASLREIAAASGISLSTARDVRERVGRGEDPVPLRQARAEQKGRAAQAIEAGAGPEEAPRARLRGSRRARDKALILQKLQRDPSVRLTDDGRHLLRWLATHSIDAKEWEAFGNRVPEHCVSLIADLALEYAEEWRRYAELLEKRASATERYLVGPGQQTRRYGHGQVQGAPTGRQPYRPGGSVGQPASARASG